MISTLEAELFLGQAARLANFAKNPPEGALPFPPRRTARPLHQQFDGVTCEY